MIEEKYDPARLLTLAAISFVGVLIFFVAAIIWVQIVNKGEANTESWAALTGLIGWATAQVSVIYNARYGTTQSAGAKDDTIKVLSQTAAVAASTVQAQQIAASAAPTPTQAADAAVPAPGQPLRVDEISVDATGATINIDKGKS